VSGRNGVLSLGGNRLGNDAIDQRELVLVLAETVDAYGSESGMAD